MIYKKFKDIRCTLFLDSFNRKNLFYDIRPKHDVEKEMIKFIRQHPNKSGVVYCLVEKSRGSSRNFTSKWNKYYHITRRSRCKNKSCKPRSFIMDDCDVIVNTIALEWGLINLILDL